MSCLSLTLVLLLVLGVSLGAAFPHDTLRKGCKLSNYWNIDPEEKKAADYMRQEFVNNHKCNTRLFYRRWNAVDLPVSDRVVLVAAELNLTTAMLELPAGPSFAEVSRRPLDFFSQAREVVRGCVDPSHQPSGRLRHWLHKLQKAMQTVSHASGVTGFWELTQPISVPAAGEHGVPESHHHPARHAGAGQPALRCPAGQHPLALRKRPNMTALPEGAPQRQPQHGAALPAASGLPAKLSRDPGGGTFRPHLCSREISAEGGGGGRGGRRRKEEPPLPLPRAGAGDGVGRGSRALTLRSGGKQQ
ncbi:hypothetical protein Nmel_010031 [Mimus melanotis]